MKLALLTIWHVGNYGAELQTYATCRCLKELGADVTLIDYRLDSYLGKSKIKRLIRSVINIFSFSNISFTLFWRKYLPKKVRYRNKISLLSYPPKADIYMVGSDQVWNPDITKDDYDAYFLNFNDKNLIRVSYASSFGVSNWNRSDDITAIVQNCLNNFTLISCREKTGVDIINNTFNIKAKNVLDPTLLLNDYVEIIGDVGLSRDLVYYPLSPNKDIEDTCKILSKTLNLRFSNINYRIDIGPLNLYRTPLKKWISSIVRAKFVVTSSFHGLTMSIIHKRQFAIIINDNLIIQRSSRVLDLLNMLDLNDRIFFSCDEFLKSGIWNKEIDYDKVDSLLKIEREKSLDFIREILNCIN